MNWPGWECRIILLGGRFAGILLLKKSLYDQFMRPGDCNWVGTISALTGNMY